MRRTMSHGALYLPSLSGVRTALHARSATTMAPRLIRRPWSLAVMGIPVTDDPSRLAQGRHGCASDQGWRVAERACQVKKVHRDGTYDVSVFSKFQQHSTPKEELLQTSLQRSVCPAGSRSPPGGAREQAPDIRAYGGRRVVREHREEWCEVQINGPGSGARFASGKGRASWLLASPRARRLCERIGKNERNTEVLLDAIGSATQWQWQGSTRVRSTAMDRGLPSTTSSASTA